jgi:hypothetical protein
MCIARCDCGAIAFLRLRYQPRGFLHSGTMHVAQRHNVRALLQAA